MARSLLEHSSNETGTSPRVDDAQAQLLQTDRLIALGTLAAGVAHEVNNPLTYVLANLDLVARSLRARADDCRAAAVVNGSEIAAKLDDLAVALGAAQQGADRVRAIVRDLTTFARTGTQHRSLLDVRSVLKPVINLVWNEIRHRARFVRDFQDVPLVDANEARLGQVFVNLLLNAVQAIPEGRADENEIVVKTFTDEAGRAVVEIRDTGSGIPADVVGHIFEPFFTTKPVGHGTGLGLSICHGAIAALGGEISVQSAPGTGSAFRVAIPPRARAEARAPLVEREARPRRILIVEDELLLADSLVKMLGDHEVKAVNRAREAIELILGGERFDVILCDLMMPVMTGMDLHEALLHAVPGQAARIAFLTGGAFTMRARTFLERVPNRRIEKPIDAAELTALVEQMSRREEPRST
jgi:nitrogen-specific signal transduction histidine kinase